MSNDYLTLEQLQKITGFSKSYIYKLTSSRTIGFFKPFGKKVYFSKSEIEAKFTNNRFSSKNEILAEAPSKKGGNCEN